MTADHKRFLLFVHHIGKAFYGISFTENKDRNYRCDKFGQHIGSVIDNGIYGRVCEGLGHPDIEEKVSGNKMTYKS